VTHRRERPAPIRFGTDGWRAVIAEEFTFENVERVAQAYADFIRRRHDSESRSADLHQHAHAEETHAHSHNAHEHAAETHPRPAAVVGYDRRFLSEQFAARVSEVLAGNQINVSLFDSDVPTPLVSWAVRERGAAGGVVLTASHNPPHFNGFKIKAPWGGSGTAETTVAVG
jgi:phosphomannomutase